jgi:hypothetical protein
MAQPAGAPSTGRCWRASSSKLMLITPSSNTCQRGQVISPSTGMIGYPSYGSPTSIIVNCEFRPDQPCLAALRRACPMRVSEKFFSDYGCGQELTRPEGRAAKSHCPSDWSDVGGSLLCTSCQCFGCQLRMLTNRLSMSYKTCCRCKSSCMIAPSPAMRTATRLIRISSFSLSFV